MLREQLAEYAHEAWAGWMRYLFEKCEDGPNGTENIPGWAVERWRRQMHTPYADLPEHEKESDRAEADKMLAIFAPVPLVSAMRRFNLVRDQDITGVSGTGIVAEGVVFSTGWVALTWLTAINSIVFYPSIDNVYHIRGHGGATRVVWLDEAPQHCPACGLNQDPCACEVSV